MACNTHVHDPNSTRTIHTVITISHSLYTPVSKPLRSNSQNLHKHLFCLDQAQPEFIQTGICDTEPEFIQTTICAFSVKHRQRLYEPEFVLFQANINRVCTDQNLCCLSQTLTEFVQTRICSVSVKHRQGLYRPESVLSQSNINRVYIDQNLCCLSQTLTEFVQTTICSV